MRIMLAATALLLCVGPAATQDLASQSRAQQLAASFNKHKDVVRQRAGVTKDKYVDVRSEPVVSRNVRDYDGAYEVPDMGFSIDIDVNADGSIRAQGQDAGAHPGSFRLENAKIENAVLTGRKVFSNGATEPFEAVFLRRAEQRTRGGPTETTLGLGVVLRTPFEYNGSTFQHLFYQLKR